MLADLKYRLRTLLRRDEVERELDNELQFHLEHETAKLIRAGVDPAEAARRARLSFGGVENVREETRDAHGVSLIESTLADLRYAARRLRTSTGFTLVAALTLAVGVGSATAIFSAVYPVLFQPLPYPDPGRLAMVWERGAGDINIDGTFGMVRELAARNRSFERLAAIRPWYPTLTGRGQPERFTGQRVSASYFAMLGVAPAMGRDFGLADDEPGSPAVVIISHSLWRRRFGADSALIGQSVTLGDDAVTVIGVLPESFESVMAPGAEIWAPLQYAMSQGRAWGHHLRVAGRLKPGMRFDDAGRELTALGDQVIAELRPATYSDSVRIAVIPLKTEVTRAVRPAMMAVAGAVLLLLLIACVNVSNLLLARGVQRRGELALRAALGASRTRIVRQLVVESLLLATVGGILGMGVAMIGVRALVALSPADVPRLNEIAVSGPAFAFGLLLTTLIGVVFGLMPAMHAARGGSPGELLQGSRRVAGGHQRARAALVIAEVALALMLLVGSALLLTSLTRLFSVDPGFTADRVLTMQVQLAGRGYNADSASDLFYARALDAVRRVPGVTAAAFTSQLPMSGDRDEYGVMFEGDASGFNTFRYAVSPGYIEAMGIPLRNGRSIGEHDRAGAPLVALINESFARFRFENTSAIGQRLTLGPLGPFTVVGVVGDVRQLSLAAPEPFAIYVPAAQWTFTDNAMSLVARTAGHPLSLAPAIREAVWSVDRDQAIVRTAELGALLRDSAAERRFALIIFEAFALAALLLAAGGIYGVLAGSVAERTREIGVRAALGASRSTIIGLVVRQGMGMAAVGIVIGALGTMLASKALVGLLFGVSRLDPATYAGTAFLLLYIALMACAVPAWRAARVDPATTLRSE